MTDTTEGFEMAAGSGHPEEWAQPSDTMEWLRELLAKASSGPWRVNDKNESGDFYVAPQDSPTWILLVGALGGILTNGTAESNAELASLAPALADTVLALVEALEARSLERNHDITHGCYRWDDPASCAIKGYLRDGADNAHRQALAKAAVRLGGWEGTA